jgi:hypothetical protein
MTSFNPFKIIEGNAGNTSLVISGTPNAHSHNTCTAIAASIEIYGLHGID